MNNSRPTEQYLGESERDDNIYEHLYEIDAATTSILSYVEPLLVMQFVASQF